jgi:hypothetical protein
VFGFDRDRFSQRKTVFLQKAPIVQKITVVLSMFISSPCIPAQGLPDYNKKKTALTADCRALRGF